MKDDIVARRYARALYDLGNEEGLTDVLLKDLEAMVQVMASSDEFRSIMESPLHDIVLKRRILAGIADSQEMHPYSKSFFGILLEKDRFAAVESILEALRQIIDEASGRVRATVTSASELDRSQVERISQALKKVIEKDVDIDVVVDPSLIGGVIAEVEGMVYDGSIRTQIARIKQSLKGEM